MNPKKTIMGHYFYIAFVVSLYWVVSILMVFVNKALLSSDLEAPLFITWFQCITTVFICLFLKLLSKTIPQYFSFPEGSPFSYQIAVKILPLSILFTGMIVMNNLCLKYVGVAFYYIGRSLTTVFNVIFTRVILGERTSNKIVVCCLVIILGFWMGVDQESVSGSLSVVGTIFGVLGSLSLSLYSIHTKKVLPTVNQDIWLLTYFNNVYTIGLFIPLILIEGEFQTVYSYNKISNFNFWFTMIIGGVCGFAIGYVTMLQIKVTSPLTHNISGTAKACVQTILATYWFGESKSLLWWLSNAVVLSASASYAKIKQVDMRLKTPVNPNVYTKVSQI